VIEEFGKTNIIINGFIEGKHCEATPTTLKFTHETWKQICSSLDVKYPGQKILGWIHTHPSFGIFLSEYDKFIQQNFFNNENQIAYVVDPIQNNEGFYFWINGNIEKCKGFYVFDTTGVKISISDGKEETESVNQKPSSAWKIVCGCIVVAFMLFMIISQTNEINRLKIQMNNLVTASNQSIFYLQQQIQSLSDNLADLQSKYDAEHPTEPDLKTSNTSSKTKPETSGTAMSGKLQ